MPNHTVLSAATAPPDTENWRHTCFLKADFFSRSDKGTYLVDGVAVAAVRRDVGYARWWARPLALALARRERRALRRLDGLPGTPELLLDTRWTIIRTWIEGAPLQVGQPRDPAFFAAARRLLVRLHRRGVVHNDLAKQQNWLVTPDGWPALIDFQLARVAARRGRAFRHMAREDLRHMLKHKRMYCPAALTPSQRRVLATPGLPSRLWRRSGKRLYNFVTRRLFGWRDGEGQGEARPAEIDGRRPKSL